VVIDATTRDVVLTLKAEDGSAFEVRLLPTIVAPLVVSLVGLGNRLGTSTESGVLGQVMHLTAAIPGVGTKSEPMLDLVLENSLHFPVTFPRSGIQVMQQALAVLQKKSTEQPKSVKH
jgi:hypothetical protein